MTEIASAYGKSYLGKPGFRFFSCRSKDPARLSLALRRAQGERAPFIGESFFRYIRNRLRLCQASRRLSSEPQ
jgi:hypothetical protein